MKCPYCRHEETDVINSRSTYHDTQIWRRRSCTYCHSVFTTYERPDIGFLKIIKKSGQKERYSRAKLYSGIYGAYLSVPDKERVVDDVTNGIEAQLLDLKEKEVDSHAVAEIVLHALKQTNMAAFLRYLAYNANPETEGQLQKLLKKYSLNDRMGV